MAGDLKVTLRRRGETAVLDLDGDIDRAAQGPLGEGFAQALTGAGGRVVLNFARVGYINSTGIAVIVGLLAAARKQRRPVAACGLGEHYQQIFSITRLSDFIDLYPDENSAVAGTSANPDNDVCALPGGDR
jgi:anti-sigma B factor antagonist